MTDFESGMRAAIRKCYPHANIHGCWFHYCAALRRKSYNLNLRGLISNHTSAREIYRKLLNLPLLLPHQIETAFLGIKKEAHDKMLHNEFKDFFQYFETFWLELVSF